MHSLSLLSFSFSGNHATHDRGKAPGNLISGNKGHGIHISGTAVSGDIGPSSNISVLGNIIGLNAAGTDALINGVEGDPGILLSGNVPMAQLGKAGASNLIVVNNGDGSEIVTFQDDGSGSQMFGRVLVRFASL